MTDAPLIHDIDEIRPGTEIVGFEPVTPLSDEICEANIAKSLKRNLKDALHRRRLHIIANGPSARKYFEQHAAWHHGEPSTVPTLALNGALGLFLEHGLTPTYWAACDPQALVADFLPQSPPEDVTYFVASKCDDAVFDRLKGREVRLWHLRDYEAGERSRVVLAPSVTISATWLMHRIGFTDFEYWGWDGCFLDGKHHAGDAETWAQPQTLTMNYGGRLEGDEIIGGETFLTTPTWVGEAHAGDQFFQLAEYFDIGITIHGAGMMRAARQAILGV